jgi:phosphoglycolate phosphatase
LGLPPIEESTIAKGYSTYTFSKHLAEIFVDDPEAAQATYVKFYRESVSTMAGLYPGIPKMLRELWGSGYQLAIFSDKSETYGLSELDQAGIDHLLEYTLFHLEGRPYKPDPSGLHTVMEAVGVTAGEALYIGDSRHDIECAHRAGAWSGAALWGSVDRETLLTENPHYRWERIEQLSEALTVA